MTRTYLTAAALLLSTAAMAQDQTPLGSTDASPPRGFWRTSDLIGHSVVGANGQSDGTISDVILSRDGHISGYVIAIGGIAGIGERKVAVPFYTVRIDPVETTASTGMVSGNLPASTAAGAKTRADIRVSNVLAPERITLDIPQDLLKSAPEFVKK